MTGCGGKLARLTSQSQYDICVPGECMQQLSTESCITRNPHAAGCNRMLKVLLHGSCSYDCAYCSVRLDRSHHSFAPRELADIVHEQYRNNLTMGLFLSSGVPHDNDEVMGGLIETARILRSQGYPGYLHLKILPGASRDDIREAARLADCISLNIETTGESRLRFLSGIKDYANDIMKRIGWIADAAPGRFMTQLIIGAAGETDREVFDCVTALYGNLHPSRIYYSGFRSLPKTRLSSRESTPAWRPRRWYQVDSLIREYGFSREELLPVLDEHGVLPNEDIKALLARGSEPLDPNTASFTDLIRVPGIGVKTARSIIAAREDRWIQNPNDLNMDAACLRRAMPYLAFAYAPRQATLALFA